MSTEKQRVTLYLTRSKYERAKALMARVPGGSVSGLVDDLLEDAVETFETLLDAAEAGDKDAQADVFSRLLAKQLIGLADEGMGVLRKVRSQSKADG